MRTLISRLSIVVLALGLIVLWSADPADAHPLGNFSVNQLEKIALYRDRVDVAATVDAAELPTLQDKSAVDADHDGTPSPAERASYAKGACDALSGAFAVTVDSSRVRWTVSSAAYEYVAGSAGLRTSRLTCALTGPAALGSSAAVRVSNAYRTDRVGWRELTAVGHGVGLSGSPLPADDVSDGLRNYPKDLLSSPLDVRSASFRVHPGASDASAVAAPTVSDGSVFARWTAAADAKLRALAGRHELTPAVGALAVLLALALGAGHAALPGHGKTVMAAYLAGRRGRRRDALVVGGTVTLTHTGGVLVLGLLLTTVAGLVGETVLGYLGVVSGLLVAGVGVMMLLEARSRRAGHTHTHDDRSDGHGHAAEPARELVHAGVGSAAAGHDHAHEHSAEHEHGHEHAHGHEHGHGHTHSHGLFGHTHSHGPERPSRLGLIGVGIAGGLVPSPSALVILLGAIGLGRTAFGILLVLGYGLGMAGALTAAGLALIVIQDRWTTWRLTPKFLPAAAARWSKAAPLATAGLVLLVGLGLAVRALIAV
ncbi:High-affinity nickel-transporter [Cryptosporangium phraense]|uniref:High-affinity nickel-transporter n=1 Tax=Cryptosporangium phraense TaxID=2593070 RepID=A0A545B034_9ACTN|nr:High-affinity nickel-transporter [Cryptosporangium phraense]TQS46940.1 High-affinity nickel-transporter [Cryptosporangium phraense]